jgi:acetolactate synthase I/II/III large subunit
MDTVAKHLIEDLLGYGIDTYFGIPGGPACSIFYGVVRTPGTTLIESKHETAALFEAIGYYKSTGKVPVVLVSAGPGISNCLTGIASAKSLRVPLLVICGDVSWQATNHILVQNGGPEGINVEATFAHNTERVLRLSDAEHASQQVIDLLTSRKANGPSIIVLPLFVSSAIKPKPVVNVLHQFTPVLCTNQLTINKVASLLDNSAKPLLVLGYGASACAYDMERLVDHLAIPFVTTAQAKGIVSEHHPLSLRHSGLAAHAWIKSYLKSKPDFLLVLGTDLDDVSIGMSELADSNTKVVHVDLNEKVFNRRYHNTLSVVADVKEFALSLINGFRSRKCNSLELIKEIKQQPPWSVKNFEQDITIPISPHRAIADLQHSAPSNIRFVTDIGEHMLFSLHYLTVGPKDFSIDLGYGSMGSGIGQAIGMCLGDKRPTICICGDGGMQMHGMEILTAIKHRLPMVFAIFNDARYNMVHHGFQNVLGREVCSGQTEYIDFVKLAHALGIDGYQINNPGEINYTLMHGWLQQGPTILDIRINKDIHLVGAGRDEALKSMGGS